MVFTTGEQAEAFPHHPIQATEDSNGQEDYYNSTVTHDHGARARRLLRQREQTPEGDTSRDYGGVKISEISPDPGVSS